MEIKLELQTDSVTEINRLHDEAISSAIESLEKGIRIGELLTQERAKTKYGKWLPWLKNNVRFSQQTASNYQKLFRNKSKLPTVGSLTDAYQLLSMKTGKVTAQQPAPINGVASNGTGKPLMIRPSTQLEMDKDLVAFRLKKFLRELSKSIPAKRSFPLIHEYLKEHTK